MLVMGARRIFSWGGASRNLESDITSLEANNGVRHAYFFDSVENVKIKYRLVQTRVVQSLTRGPHAARDLLQCGPPPLLENF